MESEEESTEVINEIVLESSADDITAASEPSELAETGCLCFENTVSVAVEAGGVVEVDTGGEVEGT